jgi:hypothetical protein
MTRLGAGQNKDLWFYAGRGNRIFYIPKCTDLAQGPTQLPIKFGTVGAFSGGKTAKAQNNLINAE